MRFKLILAFVEDSKTETVLDAARNAGATGATVINHARGEGLNKKRTFFGLTLEVQKDVVLFVVEEHLSRHILETISEVGEFDQESGQGIAVQIDIEDAVGAITEIDRSATQRLVHRHIRIPNTRNSTKVAQSFLDRFADYNARVFNGVVTIDMQISHRLDRKIKKRMTA